MTDSFVLTLPHWTIPILFFVIVYPWAQWFRAHLRTHELRIQVLQGTGTIAGLDAQLRMYRMIHEDCTVRPKATPPPPPPPPANTDPSVSIKT